MIAWCYRWLLVLFGRISVFGHGAEAFVFTFPSRGNRRRNISCHLVGGRQAHPGARIFELF